MIQSNVYYKPGDIDCEEGRIRYQNVWIVLFKFIYIVASHVPAQMFNKSTKLLI